VRYDVSQPLSTLRLIKPKGAHKDHPVKRLPHRHPPREVGRFPDLVHQPSAVRPLAATLGLNFDGMGVPGYAVTGAPPDTNGSAGATQYVQWVNTAFSVYNKASAALLYGPADGSTLWQGFGGPCETENSGDPIALYDKAAQRWVLSQFAVESQPYSQCVAVSTTSDAMGTYRRFAYNFGNGFNDYPKLGVWPDAYYVTFNMFTGGQTFAGAKVCAFDRNQMVGSGTPGPIQCFQLDTRYGGLLPADLDGRTPPPAGAPNYVVAFDDASLSNLNLWKFHVDWANPTASTLIGPSQIPVAPFSEACGGATCVAQPDPQKLDSLADRLMYRLAYRNFGTSDSLLVNHAVDVNGHAGVRWYEVKNPGSSPTVYQQGTYSPDSSHRWMGSVAMDQRGNILLGYSTSSGSVFPAIRYTGRLASDPLGALQAEATLTQGSGAQNGGLSRWGDYSAMALDPADDCTFWYTTEYLKSSGSFNWSTRVGTFRFPSCSCP
jgi:hypothetical protein